MLLAKYRVAPVGPLPCGASALPHNAFRLLACAVFPSLLHRQLRDHLRRIGVPRHHDSHPRENHFVPALFTPANGFAGIRTVFVMAELSQCAVSSTRVPWGSGRGLVSK